MLSQINGSKRLSIVTLVIFVMLLAGACGPILPEQGMDETATSAPTFTPVPPPITQTSTPDIIPVAVTPSALPTQLTLPVTLDPVQSKQQEEIKDVLKAYFDLRYQALSVSPPEDFQVNGFGDLVSDGSDAKDFLVTEMAKLAVQRKWYELKGYRYAEYEYSLQYKDIVVDSSTQVAIVSVLEDFTIVEELHMERNPESPGSTRGDLTHEIVLHNEQGHWRIISDIYRDVWWRQYRQPGTSTEEILQEINTELQALEAMPSATPWSPPAP